MIVVKGFIEIFKFMYDEKVDRAFVISRICHDYDQLTCEIQQGNKAEAFFTNLGKKILIITHIEQSSEVGSNPQIFQVSRLLVKDGSQYELLLF